MMRAFFARLTLRLMSRLPLPWVHRLGALLGQLLNRTDNSLRQAARINVRLCFPVWDAARRAQLVRACLQETAKAALESGLLWLRPTQQVMALVREVSGGELLQQAMADGKGVILAVPHLGAWEVVGLYGSLRWPMTSLYRPPKLSGLGPLIRQGRERAGATLVPTDAGGVRALYKALARGELVAILPDQDPDRDAGVFADFFGVPANTMTLLSRLAAKTGARVLMSYAERLPNGEGFHLHFLPAPQCVADKEMKVAASCLNLAVEQCALQAPAQYQWCYKRFKTRPQGDQKIY
jgi:KDO2-lipid IV(A) lauroyltransferase